ncbi:MAG: 16S rRNA (uracil(1498)-N(3))-methyltransferase [Verrucomicrobiota bacterium]|jgi:RsmE family RNA methyltransferase|nr:16S rRNA (uracil(1498)-N(3))-methyltransferase [Verrucomicrobiota bacterium]
MNLILLESGEVQADGAVRLHADRARHIQNVLHAGPGETLRVGLVDGPQGVAVVRETGPEGVLLHCTFQDDMPECPRVDLALAMPRPKVMNRLWPVLASLGVGRIFILNAWKTERSYFDTHVLDPGHFRRGLLAGLQQAKDTRLPLVSIHRRFRPWMEDELPALGAYALKWLAHPGAEGHPLPDALRLPPPGRVLLAIGPEGGWTSFEQELFWQQGFAPFSWGERPLRTDTACTVLLGLIHAGLAAATKPSA